MADVIIRKALASDRRVVWSLVAGNRLNLWNLNWRNFLVAEDDQGRVIGCGQIRKHSGLDELASLAVAEDRRGEGIAAILIEELKKVSGRPLWLMCENRLVAFYEQFGFENMPDRIDMPSYMRRTAFLFDTFAKPIEFFVGDHAAFMKLRDGE